LSYTLDHIFVLTEPAAPVADALLEHGFVESVSRRHGGQGTANRRFVLNGFFLEFLYVVDAHEATTGAGKELRLLERSTDPTACPFGIVVRANNTEVTPSFAHTMYFADYLPDKIGFYVGENANKLQEPLCICMPAELSAKSNSSNDNADKVLTELVIATPDNEHSDVLREFGKIDKVTVQKADSFNATLYLNNATTATILDLNPVAPIVIKW